MAEMDALLRAQNIKLEREIIERKKVETQREQLITDLQKALAEIKTLQGILPICSSCKKIRDDAGSWSLMEVYISNHTEVEFSHGYCPGCAQKALELAMKDLANIKARNSGTQ